MSAASSEIAVRARDGVRLAGTLVVPSGPVNRAIVLVHGGGVTRHEAGFFTRLADGLAAGGVASLRFDLRGHGESEGRQEDLTLSAILNDIDVALAQVRKTTGAGRVSLMGTSFSGGICGYFAARQPERLERLVLGNPLLNYRKRFVDDKPYWSDGFINDAAAHELTSQGYVAHSPSFKLGRALLNELFWLRPHTVLGEIQAPVLIVHGTKDTFIPVESSRAAVKEFRAPHRLVEIEGAQHGFAVHDDPTYANPQSQKWQAFVIDTITAWITGEDEGTPATA